MEFPLDRKIFLSGPAGTGKTRSGVERLKHLLGSGVPASQILILTPQRTLQEPYLEVNNSPARDAGGVITLATIGGLARRMCDLFWPLAAAQAGFADPQQAPIFLTLETAQYYMAHLIRPMLQEGYFQTLTMDRNRLTSQILDNLNKSAEVGFPYSEIGNRLDSAYIGEIEQRRVYRDTQECATRFRTYCLQHNLLDFSLQLEVFASILWPLDSVREHLKGSYHHLIYDNLEEDVPRAHDIIREWLPAFDSVLLIYDEGGGYRRFLGADTDTAKSLRELCDETMSFNENFVMPINLLNLEHKLRQTIQQGHNGKPGDGEMVAFDSISSRYYPDLLEKITHEVARLISDNQVPASDIVLLAPYLSDALRFSITHRLEKRGVPWRSHRPSRSLREEPASHALVTLAALGHPMWKIKPHRFDLAYAFMSAIEGMDLVRAQLLAEIVYRPQDLRLSSFDEIKVEVQERITFVFGNQYSILRNWLMDYRERSRLPLDHFLRKLFGEVLSQPGFGFHKHLDAIRVAASLVESVRKFRTAMEPTLVNDDDRDFDHGKEYVTMLEEGVIAASYLEAWQPEEKEAVLVAPAYTFLMMNKPTAIQFWLDIGSSGWYERVAQPLTHPYVLARGWQAGRQWKDSDEVEAGRDNMQRLVSGLLHRCRERIYICLSELGESGFEQRGELLKVFQKLA